MNETTRDDSPCTGDALPALGLGPNPPFGTT